MSVNKSKPHLFDLPEDDANRQVANGFHLDIDWDRQRRMQVLRPAGGWLKVLEYFESTHAFEMDIYPERFMVLLIDVDDRDERLKYTKDGIPKHLTDRVFILGAQSEPEDLRPSLGPLESIGMALAKECREGTDATWNHELLRHNRDEVERLRQHVRPFLFRSN
jgi:hypothetical protein